MDDDVKLPGAKMIDGQRTTISDEHVHSARGDLAANEDHNESEDRKESATSNDNEGHKDDLEQVDLNAAWQLVSQSSPPPIHGLANCWSIMLRWPDLASCSLASRSC